MESKDSDSIYSYGIDNMTMLHMQHLCLLFVASIIICSSCNEGF